jgi:pectinesterase
MKTVQRIKRACSLGVMALLLTSSTPDRIITLFTIGDSTCANKSLDNDNLERGWGQALASYFDAEHVRIDNHAVNGRSSLSFRNEGRWDVVLERIKPGDYVLIQFGHNDEKPNADRHTDPGTTYNDQLKRYVQETREKGGIPILLTPMVRRKFDEQGQLVETHGEYVPAVRQVAAETGTLLIDHNQLSKTLVQSLGPDDSKALFMWVPKGTNLAAPEGREDDTHLNARGARAMARLVAEELVRLVPDLKPYVRYYDYVVAKDGSGDFMTLEAAVQALPINRQKTTTVFIRKGIYREKIVIPPHCQHIKWIGESRDETVVAYDDAAPKKNRLGEPIGTYGSAGLFIYGDDFRAENLTFQNLAGPVGQAVAVLVAADRVAFSNCRFLGFQDTLYTWGKASRQYYRHCYIEGTVDFIFGSSTALFDSCEIRAKQSGGYLTAASTPQGNRYGYVFRHCRLTADEGVTGVYLGRPWRPYARTVFIECEMGSHIAPVGWHNWNKPEAQRTTFYAEYGSYGPGAAPNQRVKWSHQLSPRQLKNYPPDAILSGEDGWAPWME